MVRQIDAEIHLVAKIYLIWRGKYSKEVVARRVRNKGCRPLLNIIQE